MPSTEPSTTASLTIVLASNNQKKLLELRSLLGSSYAVVGLEGLGIEAPEETGSTFRDNAELKATHASDASGHIALADDSGLSVDALHGMPGVHSARYAGEHASDDANNSKLLSALAALPEAPRTARFVSAISIAYPNGDVRTVEGTCEGVIIDSPRGTGGFGYDPLFELPTGKTMAELSSAEKNAISHRGTAMRKAIPLLKSAEPATLDVGSTTRMNEES